MRFDGTLTQGGWGGGEGIESGQEKKSSKRRAEGGLPWTKKAKTCAVVAMFPESFAFRSFLLPVASGLGNMASAVVAGVDCLLQCLAYKGGVVLLLCLWLPSQRNAA